MSSWRAADGGNCHGYKSLALIPARGDSKGIRQKNIKPLAGKPLIHYTIEAALRCRYESRVVVSTDNQEVAAVARAAGAEVPFIRPSCLARDDTPMLPVLQHAVEYLRKKEGYYPDIIVILQPTSPLRTAKHVNQMLELLLKTAADSVVSLCKVEHSPYWMKKVDEEGRDNLLCLTRSLKQRRDMQSELRWRCQS